jgi:hypothetical protein
MKCKQFHLRGVFLLTLFSSLSSGSVFSIDVKNDTTSDSFIHNTSDLSNLIDTLDKDKLSANFNYTETNKITANLDFRGLPMSLKFSENSNVLELTIPSISINEVFSGQTREASIRLLEDWFKNNKKNVEKIMKELARVSPVDPIAGNPNSLMATMVADDFMNGFQRVATQQKGMNNENFILIAPVFKSLDIEGKQSDNFILPIGYSFAVGENPKETVTLSLPLSYVSVEGAKNYNVGVGASYSLPLNNEWVITPTIKYSLVGSKNLGN